MQLSRAARSLSSTATLPFEHAALFGCAVLTGVGAVMNGARVTPGDRIAVIGLGGVGMAAVLGARAAGAERIVAVDIAQAKLDIALSLGATDAYLATADGVAETIREATGGGVHHAIELAGSVAALELGYKIVRRGGTLTTGGLPAPTAIFPIQAVSLVAEEKTVRGSYLGSCVPARDIPRFIGLFRRGLLPANKLLTKVMPLAEINTGFDLLREGSLIRGVVLPDLAATLLVASGEYDVSPAARRHSAPFGPLADLSPPMFPTKKKLVTRPNHRFSTGRSNQGVSVTLIDVLPEATRSMPF